MPVDLVDLVAGAEGAVLAVAVPPACAAAGEADAAASLALDRFGAIVWIRLLD